MKILVRIVLVLAVLFFLADQCDRKIRKEGLEKASQPKEHIECMICGKDLTNDYNRIAPNGNSNYYCTPCYKQTMREVHEDIRVEGYD